MASRKHSLIPGMSDSIKRTMMWLMQVCHEMEERSKITTFDMNLQLPTVNKVINVVLKQIIRITKENK